MQLRELGVFVFIMLDGKVLVAILFLIFLIFLERDEAFSIFFHKTEDVSGVRPVCYGVDLHTGFTGFLLLIFLFYHVALYIPCHHNKNIPIKNTEVLSLKYYTKTEHVIK